MKIAKYAMIMALLTILIMLTGCGNKQYFFSFKTEQDLTNEAGSWLLEMGTPGFTDYAFDSNGINIQGLNLSCPLRFSGDLTITIKFWLKVDEEHSYWVDFGLTDLTWWTSGMGNDVHMDFYNLGSWQEHFIIEEHDAPGVSKVHYDDDVLVPGLFREGFNIYVFKKVGNRVIMSMNDDDYADFRLERYNSKWFCPQITSRREDGTVVFSYGITVESIEVIYNGDASNVVKI